MHGNWGRKATLPISIHSRWYGCFRICWTMPADMVDLKFSVENCTHNGKEQYLCCKGNIIMESSMPAAVTNRQITSDLAIWILKKMLKAQPQSKEEFH